jgi:oligopeptide transport system ATP-binding protein
MTHENILEMRDLSISFHTTAGEVKAIRGVDLNLARGKTLALVGESGSGKSVTVKAIMGILASNGKINTGKILFYDPRRPEGAAPTDLITLTKKEMRRTINGQRIAMVFQDPMTSLNPTMTIGDQVMEGMVFHKKRTPHAARARALELLELVGIPEPDKRMKNYPHQLSGGMRQRVVIAIAMSCEPDILICDEPTTALDVTIQAKILELIASIQKKLGISVVYITHDLGVVAKVADDVVVMYAGKIVEKGTVDEVFYEPRHPYTWGLLSSMPDMESDNERLYTIPGNPPNLLNKPAGDAFAVRNAFALKIDHRAEPPMFKITDTHYAATWLLDPRAPKVEMPAALRERIERIRKEARG